MSTKKAAPKAAPKAPEAETAKPAEAAPAKLAPAETPAGGAMPEPETAAERKARLAKDPLVSLSRPTEYPEGHVKEGQPVPQPHTAEVPRSEVAAWVQSDQLWVEDR
jgi:hypothetical protein